MQIKYIQQHFSHFQFNAAFLTNDLSISNNYNRLDSIYKCIPNTRGAGGQSRPTRGFIECRHNSAALGGLTRRDTSLVARNLKSLIYSPTVALNL